MDWPLEVVVLPVSDIATAIAFYRDKVGFELDHDTRNEHMHVVQLTPREDELPRVVRIPGGRGAYVLEQTFGEAEALRTEWCRNSEHSHPYASWHEARTYFCRHDTND